MSSRRTNKLVVPFVKWVGGKRQILSEIEKYLPSKFATYYEPFIGGGALLFHIQPKNAIINDFNAELINLYTVIKENPLELIADLKKHKNEADYFYEIRSLDRDREKFSALTNIERASRIIFLNKTCYNGLFRVNSSGEFNTPFGRYKNPNIVNEITIKAVSLYLNSSNVLIMNGDFEEALHNVSKGDFVYLDPPYDPLSNSSSFTGYTQGGFDRTEQERLRNVCDWLHAKKAKFLLSNSCTDLILDLYKNYNITEIKAIRSINSDAEKRGQVSEVLIRNYE